MRGSLLVLSFARLGWSDVDKILPTVFNTANLVFCATLGCCRFFLYSGPLPELLSSVDNFFYVCVWGGCRVRSGIS